MDNFDVHKWRREYLRENKNMVTEGEDVSAFRQKLHALIGNEMRLGKRADMSGASHHTEEHKRAEKEYEDFLRSSDYYKNNAEAAEKVIDAVTDHFTKQLYENEQSIGGVMTPQKQAEEMIADLGSKRLALETVDEILNIEVLQERYKEYWREVKEAIKAIKDEGIEDEEFFIELEDYLVNKALDTGRMAENQKNAWPKTHIKLTYRVETPDLNYSLVLGTTFESTGGDRGDFQGDYVKLENFDKVGPKWEEYKDEFDYLEDIDVDSLNRKTQVKLEEAMDNLKQNWYEDYFN
jgi:hypothetical protein